MTAPTTDVEKPRLIIKPRKGWVPAHPGELWEFRELCRRFAARDITLRYRQTLLGVVWVVLLPLLGAGLLTFVFGGVADLQAPGGVPYFVFSLAGMVAWTAFSQVLTRSAGSLVGNASMVQKVFFPRLLLPLSTVISTMVDVVVSLGLLAVVMALTATAPGPQVLLFPVWLLAIVMLSLGVGMGAGALMVRYRDVQYVIPVATQFLLYATPVAYAVSNVPESVRTIFQLNPLVGLIDGFRWAAIGTSAPSAGATAYSIASAVVVFVLGAMLFNRMERSFADVI